METFIYGLVCPKSNQVRYVGKTRNPSKRLREHVYRSKGKSGPKQDWINSLTEEGLTPLMKTLEVCQDEDWIEAEIKWISSFSDLTNRTEGGEDWVLKKRNKAWNSGLKNPYTKETRKKMSDSAKARGICLTPEGRKQIADAARGRKPSRTDLWKMSYGRRIYTEYSLDGVFMVSHIGVPDHFTKKRKSHPLNLMYIRGKESILLIHSKDVSPPPTISPRTGCTIRKFIVQTSLDNKEVCYHYSAYDASMATGLNEVNIQRASLKGEEYRGFRWRYSHLE